MTLSRSKSTPPPVNKQEENNVDQQRPVKNRSKSIKKKWLAFALRVAVTIILFVFLARSVSWSTLVLTLPHVQHTELLLSLAVSIVCLVFSSYVWHSLLFAEGIPMD